LVVLIATDKGIPPCWYKQAKLADVRRVVGGPKVAPLSDANACREGQAAGTVTALVLELQADSHIGHTTAKATVTRIIAAFDGIKSLPSNRYRVAA